MNQMPPTNSKIQSFLEALRAGGSKPKDENQINNPFAELTTKREIEKKRIIEFHQSRTQEWNHIFKSSERDTARKIESIKEQIKNIAKEQKILNQNLATAVASPVSREAVGEYQISFLEHLLKRINEYLLDVQEANSWFQIQSSRQTKRNYWSIASKHGNSYTQNNERAVATSIG